MFNNMLMGAAGESIKATSFSVDNSMLLNDDDSQYLSRENASNSTTGGDDARKKFTVSLWWKHGNIPSGGQNLYIQRNSSANYMKCAIAGSGGNEGALQFFGATLGAFSTGDSTAILRDFHAWYHILFYYDSTDGTAGDRARIYLNGTRLTDFQTSATNPSSGAITQFGSNNPAVIGQNQAANGYSDGYMAEMVVIDGQALTPSSFTETDSNGVLRPLDISAQSFTFGDQGFYLPFSNSVELGVGAGPVSSTAATVSFLQVVRDSGSGTNYTFSSQNLGTAASDRIIAVHVASERSSAGARTVSSLTVAGVSAALVVRNTSPNGDTHELWEAQVPSGTSGDVVVNHSGSMTGSSIALYAIYNAKYQDHYTVTDSGTTLSQNLVIPNNSIAIAGASDVDADIGTGTFTGVTERFDQAIDASGSRAIAGGDTSTDSGTGATTIAFAGASSTSTDDVLFAAVWFPSDGPNNFTGVNSPTQTTDSPTSNFAVSSQLQLMSGATLAEGNLKVSHDSNCMSQVGMAIPSSGKYYFECLFVSGFNNQVQMIGVAPGADTSSTMQHSSVNAGSTPTEGVYINARDGDKIVDSGFPGSSYGSSIGGITYGSGASSPNSIVQVAIDADNGTIWFGNANTWFNSATASEIAAGTTTNSAVTGRDFSVAHFPTLVNTSTTSPVFKWNFGQLGFTYTPPTGYVALNAANAFTNSAPAIEDGSKYMQSTAYTGNTSADHAILQTENAGGAPNSTFKPDFIWFARRDSGDSLNIYDVVRGVTKRLRSNLTSAEDTTNTANMLKTFDAAGFTVGDDGAVNGTSMVAWQWLADNTSGSSNSDGSITSTVSVNQTAGFSIVTWTGTGANATVGHGLGAVPSWILVKQRTDADSWTVYHAGNTSAPETEGLTLDSTAATQDAATFWNDTAPTSTVFSLGSGGRTNGSSDSLVAYCWCEKPGFSKFGKFEGNGSSTDGPFIELGFKPAWFMWKNIDSATNGDWTIMDAARDPFNMVESNLRANSNMAADTGEADLDFLSNGVKHRGGASARFNASATYIYMAFAEHPFAGTTPATAR